MDQRLIYGPFLSYELSFGTILANVGRLGAKKNCVRQTMRQTQRKFTDGYMCVYVYIYVDKTQILCVVVTL